MTYRYFRSSEEQARLEKAAIWLARVQGSPEIAQSEAFQTFIADADNLSAYDAVDRGLTALDEVSAAPRLLEMRRDALSRARYEGARKWLTYKRAMAYGVAALLVLTLLGAPAVWFLSQQPMRYVTDVGERRIVVLSDGSRVALDSDTQIRVKYSKSARTLELDRGRARFDVAHDVARPFTVTAGSETVVAVGTAFNVERVGQKVLVTLIQGRIVIKTATDTTHPAAITNAKPVSLIAGEEFVAAPAARASIAAVNVAEATAWETGRLVFRNETLGEAVERVNRYTDHPIAVDPAIVSFHISGAFNAGDIGSFVGAVTSYFPVQATTTPDNQVLLQPRS